MTGQPTTLINLMKVQPDNQPALIKLLEQNIEQVVSTLGGWRGTRLIAAQDGAAVIIHSEWDSPAAIEAMRNDSRMQAYFPRILELASVDSTMGELVFSASR
jgi:quinol monooxygenase YgiN